LYLIDANIFLELMLDQAKADECEKFLTLVHKDKREALVTDLTLDSVLIVLENKGRKPSDLRLFLSSIASYKGMTIYFLALSDRLGATRLMEDLKLDYEDSTVAQVAKRLSVEGVVSFDKDFDRVQSILRVEPAALF
jgi:predicted nucleic acid-binding protein